MESRKDLLSSIRLCRFCLSQESLASLYDSNKHLNASVPLKLKILSCISVEVFPSDRMPTFICSRCKFFMEMFYEFKEICHKADSNIFQYIQNGAALKPVAWPASLSKLFSVDKSSKVNVMKTVVEGGATIQVSTQEISDDEDDENVYNVKIGDGPDEQAKSARVKLITGDEQESIKSPIKRKRKGFSTLSKLAKHVRTHAGERAYPCKFCDKSFMKSHHYTRHLRLKHRETVRTARGPFGEAEQFRCEQCSESFAAQDDYIYHSAIHATQNLTCPLCQERFLNVDDVTAHIKSHVTGTEFMCDYCELVFTSKEKLDVHLVDSHEDEMHNNELEQDESSMEAGADEEDEDDDLNVKEDGDQMIVEINKPDNFMLPTTKDESDDKDQTSNLDDKVIELGTATNVLSNSPDDADNKTPSVNSEESESEATYPELSTVETLNSMKRLAKPDEPRPKQSPTSVAKQIGSSINAPIVKKAEEIKRKAIEKSAADAAAEKSKERVISKVEGNNSVGANDKSLRLLEKELQELKRTNPQTATRSDAVKPVTTFRGKRPQIHTSTPKVSRIVEEKKVQLASRSPAIGGERRVERRVTKENKEPPADDKDTRDIDTPKSFVKNGVNDKGSNDEGIRRSTRPSKIKDYAKMIRDSSQESNDDDSDNVDDEEYKEDDKSPEQTRPKSRRISVKQTIKTTPTVVTPASGTKKRGRPRKEQGPKKADAGEPDAKVVKNTSQNGSTPAKAAIKAPEKLDAKNGASDVVKKDTGNNAIEPSKTPTNESKLGNVLISPTGQTLKKVPIKALPPGVKPLPLPASTRQIGGEVCEMQIGKKMVKVQKIVMTKAEVEAMAKKGLVEMKDGTMVLKQGIKLPSADATAFKSLVGEEAGKESLSKKEKGTPMRCDLEDDES